MSNNTESCGGEETAAADILCPFVVPSPGKESGWKVKECFYSGPIPLKVMRFLNKAFINCAAGGYFEPTDPMDAYQTIFIALNKRAGEPIYARNGDSIKFLKGVVIKLLKNYYSKYVAPIKAKNEKLEALIVAAKHDNDDAEDVNLMEQIPDDKANQEWALDMTVQEYAEEVKYLPYSKQREAMSKAFVQKLYDNLEQFAYAQHNLTATIAVWLFKKYIDCNGNKYETEKSAHLSHGTFVRRWDNSVHLTRNLCADMTL